MMVSGNGISRRILHTSDIHMALLGDRACSIFRAVIDVAKSNKADLVIIAGDLFDHNQVDGGLVKFVVEQLRRLSVSVVILPGNHDCLAPGSVFENELWWECDNVKVLKTSRGETLALPDLGILLWGKPIDSYEDIKPLVGIPAPEPDGQWHIAMAHGYYIGNKPPLFPSYHITEQEVANSGWDYIALGHLMIFECVCDEPVKAYYSGSPLSGTVAIVDLDEETGVHVTRYSLELE